MRVFEGTPRVKHATLIGEEGPYQVFSAKFGYLGNPNYIYLHKFLMIPRQRMTQPRSKIVSLTDTSYYHCISRCVRQAWLCGEDSYTGKNFDHRKPWLLDRLRLLGEIFAIDIAAYAVMSNHYHVVLHVDQARCRSWDRDEVIRRWRRLHMGDPLVRRYLRGELQTEEEYRRLDMIVDIWRDRLISLSWFMKSLNEYIARKANQEDDCKGRFWEGRFKSQALLDNAALLSCMAYVDLNPVRAGISTTLESSNFTSVQTRIRRIAKERCEDNARPLPRLMPFRSGVELDDKTATLPFDLKEYIELVDWTGRIARKDKRGHIPANTPKMLSTMRLTEHQWRMLALEIQKEAITMFKGLDKLAAREKRGERKAA